MALAAAELMAAAAWAVAESGYAMLHAMSSPSCPGLDEDKEQVWRHAPQ